MPRLLVRWGFGLFPFVDLIADPALVDFVLADLDLVGLAVQKAIPSGTYHWERRSADRLAFGPYRFVYRSI